MTATLIKEEKKMKFSSTSDLGFYFIIASVATIFDAWSSYLIIAKTPIAIEGNPIWGAIAEHFGFAGAMVIRAIGGVIGLLILLWLANRKPGKNGKIARGRTIARFGMRFVTVLLFLLALWHIFGVYSAT